MEECVYSLSIQITCKLDITPLYIIACSLIANYYCSEHAYHGIHDQRMYMFCVMLTLGKTKFTLFLYGASKRASRSSKSSAIVLKFLM